MKEKMESSSIERTEATDDEGGPEPHFMADHLDGMGDGKD